MLAPDPVTWVTAARSRARLIVLMRASLTVALLAVTACGGSTGSTGFSSGVGSALTTAPAESTGSTSGAASTSTGAADASTTSTSTSTGSDSAADSAPLLDMAMPDFGPQQPEGCKGKIDFLFVISANSTMAAKQERLLASFPGFMKAIEDQLPNFDVHILSAEDGYWLQEDCNLCTEDCDPNGSPPLCDAALEFCDKKSGAGGTFPSGEGASNRRCKLASGARYIDSSEPDRTEAFTCIAQLGIDGDASTAERMVNALEDPYDCNDGFLREDALLVVTLIQDNYDVDSLGTVESWKKALQDAKDGDDDAFALLVLSTDVDVGYHQLCHYNDYDPEKNRLRVLAEGVEHGFIGSICAPSYELFFAETVAALVTLCEEFTPPG